MLQAILRSAIPLCSLLILGPLAALLTGMLRSADGGHAASLLVSTSGLLGLLVGVGVLALAAIGGLAGARLVSTRTGLLSAGLVLACGAWGTGRVDEIMRVTQSASSLTRFAFEGLFVGVLGVGLAAAIVTIGRPPTPSLAANQPPQHPEPRDLLSRDNAAGLVVGVLVGAVVVYLLAQETLKGQTFAAAAIGGLAAAIAGRLTAHNAAATAFIAALALLGAASPVIAGMMHGSAAVSKAAGGTLLALARPLPLDYLAGAFVGVPIGLSWASSMVVGQETVTAHQAPGTR